MSKCDCEKNGKLSPAVLQINNHDCPTVFHKVTFPAAMGDDETNPPRNGQYRNVLLVYEANGHVYMFSSDGIPTFISDGGQGVDDYNELTNKPSIEGHELIGDSSLEDIGVTDAIEDALEDYTPTSEFAEVAFTGDYDDLIGTPAIPTKTSDLTNDGSDGTSTYVEADQLATVATTGAYSDLSGTPTIPTVNDATLTIQRNGTNVQTFTANASSNVTADISVPTKTSDLTNDGSDNTAQYLETDETAYKTASIPYGECDSTSTATEFTATVPGITELRDGVCMWLKNGTVTSASGFTINVNNLGAKPVYSNMSAVSAESTLFNVNYTFMFVYDSSRVAGGCWVLNRGYNSNDNTIGYQIRTNSTSLTTTDRTRYYRILFTSADNTHWVPANTQYDNSATSNKTINQRKINPFGRIVYLGSATSYLADAAVSATVVWDQYAFNLGYSFAKGSALTMTFPKPVYIKCAPQTDGSAIIDSTTPYVQDLPTTDDGKIYIFLGIAYSATNIELVVDKPVYYYKDGSIRLWTNAAATGGGGPTVVQTTGQSTTDVMSQKAVTDELALKADASSLATVATSGSYNDLSNKPTIPAAQVNSDWSANSGVAQILNKPTLATVATSGSYNDLTDKPTIDFELVEMSYGESNAWAKFIAAYQGHKIVYCRASSNSNPATGSQTRKAFMAYVNNAENPTEVEFQYVRSVSTKTSSQPVDQVFVYKLTSASGGTWTVQTRDMGPKLAQGTNTTVSYSNGTYTISATQPTVPTVVQTTGQSTTDVMSQKAVTDIIGNVETILQTLNNGGGAQ